LQCAASGLVGGHFFPALTLADFGAADLSITADFTFWLLILFPLLDSFTYWQGFLQLSFATNFLIFDVTFWSLNVLPPPICFACW